MWILPPCLLNPGKRDLTYAEQDTLKGFRKPNREPDNTPCSPAMKIALGIMTGVMTGFGVCNAVVTAHACSAERLPWLWTVATGPADSACGQAGPGENHLIPTQHREVESILLPT